MTPKSWYVLVMSLMRFFQLLSVKFAKDIFFFNWSCVFYVKIRNFSFVAFST